MYIDAEPTERMARELEDVAKSFRRLPSEIASSFLDQALLDGAREIAKKARQISHVDADKPNPLKRPPSKSRGRMRRSLRGRGYKQASRRRIGPGGELRWQKHAQPRVTFGGPGAFHAVFHEFGTKGGIKPRLILTKAVRKFGDDGFRVIIDNMRKYLAGLRDGRLETRIFLRLRPRYQARKRPNFESNIVNY